MIAMKYFAERINSAFRKIYINRGRICKHLALNLIVAILIISSLYTNNDKYNDAHGVVYEAIVFYSLFVSILYLNLYVLAPRFLLKRKWNSYFSLLLLCIIIVFFMIAITQGILSRSSSDEREPIEQIVNLIGSFISFIFITMTTSVYALFKGWLEDEKQIYELESATVEAELQHLKNQINPHFLFNMINNANIKVTNDPPQAYHIISKLEELLRYQLTDSSQEFISLEKDISFLRDYLDLEKIRRKGFEYTMETDIAQGDCRVPPLLFTTFVENAVKHSHTTRESSYIHVKLRSNHQELLFHCQNSKPSIPVRNKVGGIGLANIRRRLELLYGEDYTLNIMDSKTSYTVNLNIKL